MAATKIAMTDHFAHAHALSLDMAFYLPEELLYFLFSLT